MKDRDFFAISFGATIKQLRKIHKLTQEELAFRSSIDRSFIAYVETGKHVPSLKTVYKLAKGFDISLTLLVSKFETATNDFLARDKNNK